MALNVLAADWPALSRRLDEALALPPSRLEDWLGSLPETDSVKNKLRQLLADAPAAEASGAFEAPPRFTLGPAPAPTDDGPGMSVGAQIGPYRLVRELGVGGMGQVWLAERADGTLNRQVALKLPRVSWTRGLAERMSRERDILARLDHPNIARIYDAGLDAQGRPYLALEYVEGKSIDVHCSDHALSLRERLLLLLEVARAVAHAHARLVVHRDLKPANILVNAAGQVRLLDFGIAKLLEGELTQETQLTQQAGRALTPDYASPEQIRGEPLGTASDVYSLGVVAYQLLAGRSPYMLGRLRPAELETAIASIDPPPASRACADAATRRQLQGDLDAVLNKALKKDPVERYPTVDALIADIERHLNDLPVQAQPDTFGYRVGKFVQRHRLPVALGSVAALALGIGVSLALWQAHSAAQQRDRALALLSRNQAITEFLGLFVTESAQTARPMKLSDMLERSEAMAEKQFRDAPEDRAVVLAMLGMYRETLGEAPKAEALLKRAVESARGSSDESFKARLTCQYAKALEMVGRIDEARRDLLATVHRSDIDAETASECFTYLAYLAGSVGDGPGAVAHARHALERLQASRTPSPARRAVLTGELAYALHLSGSNDAADDEFATSMALFEQLGREASAEAMAVRSNWGHVRLTRGDANAALVLYDEILALAARAGGGDPPPYVLASRASALQYAGRYRDAAAAFAFASAAAEKAGKPSRHAFCLLGIGAAARELGDLQRAESYLAQVERMDPSARSKGGPVALAEHVLRARIAMSRGELARARAEFTHAVGERRPNGGVVRALTGRAEVGLLAGRLDLARADVDEALKMAQALQGDSPYSAATGLAWLVRGEIQARTADTATTQPRDAFLAAIAHLSQTVDATHPALLRARRLAAQTAPAAVDPLEAPTRTRTTQR